MSGITELLIGWNRGDKGALDRLMPLVYEELRNVARRHLANEGREHTLESAALVNETYLRLVDQRRVQWRNRTHFFAISARMMRRILVDAIAVWLPGQQLHARGGLPSEKPGPGTALDYYRKAVAARLVLSKRTRQAMRIGVRLRSVTRISVQHSR